ncbi:MAG: copper chaperone PCu(A)C [Sphingomonadales bacterium]
MLSTPRIVALSACILAAPAWAQHDHVVKAGSLEIVHPWSRATPGGAKVAGGYVTVVNKGTAPDRLVGAAAASIAASAEIHETSMTDGVMRMKPAAGIAVPAGGTLGLKPGSYHIMFMGLKRPLKQGETFAGSLTFEKAGQVDVQFTVEALGAAAPAMSGSAAPQAPMDHGAMGHDHH